MQNSSKLAAAIGAAFILLSGQALAQGIQEGLPETVCATGGVVPPGIVLEHALHNHGVILSRTADLAAFAQETTKLRKDYRTNSGLSGERLRRWNLAESARGLVTDQDTPTHGRTRVAIRPGAPVDTSDRIHQFLSLQSSDWLSVECTAATAPVTPSTTGEPEPRRPNPILSYLGQIHIARDLDGAREISLSDRTFATISGKDDHETGEETASFEGVALFPTIVRPFGNAEISPYIGYHRTDSNTAAEDINDLTFGGLLTFSEQGIQDSWLPAHHHFAASLKWETDDAFDSSVTIAEVTYNPVWGGAFGNKRRIPNCLGGHCAWDVSAVLDYAEVGDPGEKTALLTMDEYGRTGLNVEAGYYLEAFEGEISLTGEYRTRDDFTGDDGSAERFVARLAFTPGDDARISIGIDYVDGQDLTSFEEEEYLAISIGFRN